MQCSKPEWGPCPGVLPGNGCLRQYGEWAKIRDVSPRSSLAAVWLYLPFQIGFKIWESVDILPTGDIC